jgi:homospermidine synthase
MRVSSRTLRRPEFKHYGLHEFCRTSPSPLDNKKAKMAVSKILFVGFGSVGQAVAPLLVAHWNLTPDQVRAVAADNEGAAAAAALGIKHTVESIVPENLSAVLDANLGAGDLLINVSVDVSSTALIEWCQAHGVLYLDTCIEPWAGGYVVDADRSQSDTTNYALRETALALRCKGRPSAVVAHGANPGIISHLAKAGLLEMAAVRGLALEDGPHAWGRLAQTLGVRVMHIAERDTQRADVVPVDTFVNTWSVDGLLSEAWQSAECGWGSHEKTLPPGASKHAEGSCSGIFLAEHSASVRVQSWVPNVGAQKSYLITHHEALSLADLLTVPCADSDPNSPTYRPTVYYAYTPCEATQASLETWAANGYADPRHKRVLRDELVGGEDQLGVLFVFEGGAFWYGSTVDLQEARAWTPFCNATSLQVVGGILGALDWMVANPLEGVVEAEDLPHQEVLDVAMPYLGRVQGHWTTWQPENREQSETSDPLQFSVFRV